MRFSYRGFEQQQGVRRLTILGIGSEEPARGFHFNVDLLLLAQHHIGLQELPSLCFNLLTNASSECEDAVAKYNEYTIGGSDLSLFTAPRRAAEAARANKQPYRSNRRPVPATSQPSFARDAAPLRSGVAGSGQ
jgi:hypothetical protein